LFSIGVICLIIYSTEISREKQLAPIDFLEYYAVFSVIIVQEEQLSIRKRLSNELIRDKNILLNQQIQILNSYKEHKMNASIKKK
jgi:hypothetical protein